MKLALFMSCATALRLAPTMVQQPRRAVLAGGAAAAGSLIVPPALAKKPLCLPGTNPASALGGPGYTIGILVARCVEINCDCVGSTAWDSPVDFRTGARHALLRRVAQGPRELRERPAVRLPAGVQGHRRVLHQDDGGQAQRPGRRARRARAAAASKSMASRLDAIVAATPPTRR